MAEALVRFDAVWKKYRRGERHDSLRDLVPAVISRLLRKRTEGLSAHEFWAVEDVSFEVAAGEALGIIGPNGAGKSTTLKLLTRILRPNRGTCRVTGRVGALIEVAAGFHPDLTGRENVYLQGAIMGMKQQEVARKLDEIIEFAGVGEFIDTQVKRYSSGMNARLGFAIAAHLDPDVLIIDEVLSVGDMAFQERCVDRMHGFKRDGVAIVFVSHNLQAVGSLCSHGLYLNRTVRASGSALAVIDHYVRDSFGTAAGNTRGEVTISSVSLRRNDGAPVIEPVRPGERLCLDVTYEYREPISDLTFAVLLHRSNDQLKVYDAHFSEAEIVGPGPRPQSFAVRFDVAANLTRGQYYFDVFVYHNPTQRFIARVRPAAHLAVSETRTWGGVADLAVRPSLRLAAPRG